MVAIRLIATRALIGAAALIAMAAVGRVSLANVLALSDPDAALSLVADQPDALAIQAFAAISPKPTKAGIEEAITMSRAALRADPTNAPAAAYLALAFELSGLQRRSIGLMNYSERLSRRDLVTQLWFIEYEVAQGNIAGALKHYDNALRSSPVAPTILFPVLVSATGNDAILAPLARMVAHRPLWGEQFVQQLVQSGTSLGNISRFLMLLMHEKAPVADRALATFIDRLVGTGRIDEAWALYMSYRPDGRRNQIRNSDFDMVLTSPTAFDWTFPDNEGASADIREGALHFDAATASGGQVARQLLELPAGGHMINGDVAGVPARSETSPYLSIQCLADGIEISRLPLVTGGGREARFSWSFSVPTRCPVQALTLTTQLADTPGGLSGQLDWLAIVR